MSPVTKGLREQRERMLTRKAAATESTGDLQKNGTRAVGACEEEEATPDTDYSLRKSDTKLSLSSHTLSRNARKEGG